MVIAVASTNNGNSKVAGTTITRGFITPFEAGQTCIWLIVMDNLTAGTPVVTDIAVVAGETATWQRLAFVNSPQAAAGAGVRMELWRLDPTVTGNIPIDTPLVTLSASVTAKAFAVLNLTGVGAVSGSIVADSVTAHTGIPINADDLFLVGLSTEDATAPAAPSVSGFTATALLNASAATTGGSAVTNVATRLSPYLITSGTTGADTAPALVDGGHITLVLSPAPSGPQTFDAAGVCAIVSDAAGAVTQTHVIANIAWDYASLSEG